MRYTYLQATAPDGRMADVSYDSPPKLRDSELFLVNVYQGEVEPDAPANASGDPERLERIWTYHNIGEGPPDAGTPRPLQTTIRSMSVGDFVVLHPKLQPWRVYVCAPAGWGRVRTLGEIDRIHTLCERGVPGHALLETATLKLAWPGTAPRDFPPDRPSRNLLGGLPFS